ncbi:MAG: bifunctional UDP-sugar hydrolase/5'-nucleotidase [Eubacteriales bacterium]|nr:bifunctional UDP-sugar hydrolase/5'-nucleotidase [Eubacteriales bacterium]
MRKLLSFICSVLLIVALCVPAYAADAEKSNDIVILYTNDVHAYIDGPLSYDTIGALKQNLEKEYRYVLLVDAGDHIQGTAYGSMDEGASIIQLMNKTGYDLATPGNHEFDYGMDTFLERTQEADFPYISCNLYHQTDVVRGENVLESFQAYHFGKEIVAFVGITTPESIVKSTPAYFQDENGNYCYGISGGDDGQALYDDVQSAVDAIRRAGATKVIAVGHLGDDLSSSPWTSEEVIAHVSGLDAFIDGHSHSEVSSKQVMGADGQATLLTQAGEYLNCVGIMIIDYETGDIRSDLISCEEILKTVKNKDGTETSEVSGYRLSSELYTGPEWVTDYTIAFQKKKWINKVDLALKQKIGESEVTLDNYSEDGTRLVRMQETNTGDFSADALYYLFDQMDMDVDAAIVNGGGIRNQAVKGVMTYKTCKDIHTFGNMACLQTVTGQQLLDALEWGSRFAGGEEECSGFLQVSGIRYQIDTQWPDSTQKDENEMWIGGPTGGYRVHDVELYDKAIDSWKPLDTQASYRLAGYNYILRNSGDGFNMFSSAVNVVDYVMEDYMVLANYVQAFEDKTVMASNSPLLEKYPGFEIDYETVNGSGRIVNALTDHTPEPTVETTVPTETEEAALATESPSVEMEAAPFPVIPLLVAVISLVLILCLIVFVQKKQIKEEN